MGAISLLVALGGLVSGAPVTRIVCLLAAAFLTATEWETKLSSRHAAASAAAGGSCGGDAGQLFGTAFWVVFGTIVLCYPAIFIMAPLGLFIRTS